jgi:NAD(P)-dependent dehydrogenase (short-subunit alcohol dehydrogenase family)
LKTRTKKLFAIQPLSFNNTYSKTKSFLLLFFKKEVLSYFDYMEAAMTGRVEGKVALVTGGANGIGLACAELMAQEGAHVVIADIDGDAAAMRADRLRAPGKAATPLGLDVTDPNAWLQAVAGIDREFGRLDVLVNNAGLATGGQSIAEFSLESWRLQQAVNVEGVFLGIKHALPLMRRGGGGSIVNMSSIAGLVGSAGMACYAATKGAVRLFTKSVALECASRRDGVRVNSVHPGLIDTSLWDAIFASAGTKLAGLEQAALSAVPLGTVGTPLDVAWGVLYLASDEARYITGSELVIDGGLTAR